MQNTNSFKEEVTLIIKTFERYNCLNNLLISIRTYYPELLVIIADDSKVKQPIELEPHWRLMELPFDVGLSAGRNQLVDEVKTPYFILLDDDFEIVEKTRFEFFYETIKRSQDLDILGGALIEQTQEQTNWRNKWRGNLSFNNGVLTMSTVLKRDSRFDYIKCDYVLNFFIAKTKNIQCLRWDDELKLNEHFDFFIRAKQARLNVGFLEKVKIFHHQESSEIYDSFRKRDYRKKAMGKHGIREIRDFHGRKFKLPSRLSVFKNLVKKVYKRFKMF